MVGCIGLKWMAQPKLMLNMLLKGTAGPNFTVRCDALSLSPFHKIFHNKYPMSSSTTLMGIEKVDDEHHGQHPSPAFRNEIDNNIGQELRNSKQNKNPTSCICQAIFSLACGVSKGRVSDAGTKEPGQ